MSGLAFHLEFRIGLALPPVMPMQTAAKRRSRARQALSLRIPAISAQLTAFPRDPAMSKVAADTLQLGCTLEGNRKSDRANT